MCYLLMSLPVNAGSASRSNKQGTLTRSKASFSGTSNCKDASFTHRVLDYQCWSGWTSRTVFQRWRHIDTACYDSEC